MVDGVNFNPFTNKVFTSEEIEKLDTNKDGVVSNSELKAQWAWLAGQGQDEDGDVEIGGESNLLKSAQKAGVSSSAATESEFRQSMATIADEYIEQYMTKHLELTDSQRSAFQTLVSNSTNEFIMQYLAQNPEGPWDIAAATTAFETQLDADVAANDAALQSVNSAVAGYENNIDTNYDSMVTYAQASNANKNISNAEWNAVRNKAVQYLMGQMLAGNSNDDLLLNMDSKYQSNSYYKEALNAINELKSSSDPVEMQRLLTEAQKSLNMYLNNVGREKVVGTIEDYAAAKEEAAVTEKISAYADSWVERNITSDMSDEDKLKLKSFALNCVTKFSAKLAEEGTDTTKMSDNELKAQFAIYLDEQKAALDSNQEMLTKAGSRSAVDYNTLISVSDSASANGNISDEEKKSIVEAGTTLVLNQLLSDMEDIPLLQGLSANYKDSVNFKEIKTLIDTIKNSVDPDEIKTLTAQAQELISKMLDSYSGEQLASAVDSTKPVEVDSSTKDKIVYNSSISNDYSANVSRSTSRGKQSEELLQEIQAMAKQDLEAVAESMKAQLKEQLGTAYNETEIQKYINDAINDTISTFTENVSRRNGHGNYNTGSDEDAFVFLRRSGTKKGRYVYNVQALTDTFIEKFNANCKEKTAAKNDPSLATYDKENVIAESLGNEYTRDTRVQNNDQAALYATAKAKLMSVAAAIKSSLTAEGCNIDSSKLDALIDDSVMTTMNEFDFNTVAPERMNFIERIKYNATKNSFSTKELVDSFMSKIDAGLEELRKKS